jgi:hypothetical protein
MRNVIALTIVGLTLAGCGGGGLNRARPDEFAVARRAPLVVPPDFALAPPSPGAARPQEADSSTQALQAMFGGPAPRSAPEQAALGNAGANRAVPGIRSEVGSPDTTAVDKGAVTRDIVAAPEGDGQDARASTTGAAPAATPTPAPSPSPTPKN